MVFPSDCSSEFAKNWVCKQSNRTVVRMTLVNFFRDVGMVECQIATTNWLRLRSLKKKPHEVKLLSDTSRDAEQVQLEILRKKSPAEKLLMVCQLNNTMRTLMMNGIELRYPKFTDQQRRRKLMDQILGEALAETVYGIPNYDFDEAENRLSDE